MQTTKWHYYVKKDLIRNQFVIPYIIELINRFEIKKVIDIGSGSGYVAAEVSRLVENKITLFCIDKSGRNINFSKKTYDNVNGLTFVKGSFENLIIKDIYDLSLVVFTFVDFKINNSFIKKISLHTSNNGYSLIVIPDFLSDILEMNDRDLLISYLNNSSVELGNKEICRKFSIPFVANKTEKIIELMYLNNFTLIDFKNIKYKSDKRFYILLFRSKK